MIDVFAQFSLIIGFSVVVALVMKTLRQPLLLSYILTGVLVGPAVLGWLEASSNLEFFSSLGVSLLLFIIGLGLNPQTVKEVGFISAITGLGHVVFAALLGWGLALLLGLDWVTGLYLSVAFTFSSTIITTRLLSAKGEEDTLYGRISVGFLLVQDLFALFTFVFLASFESGAVQGILPSLLWTFLKLGGALLAIYVVARYIIPRIHQALGESTELLFLFALGLCLSLATAFGLAGFSRELGALAAGMMLAVSPLQREIAVRMQPLRDFFLIIFFLSLGAHLTVTDLVAVAWPAAFFTLFVAIGGPFIVLLLMSFLGYTRKTSFLAGLTVSQISEFSLIMVGMGIHLGHIPPQALVLTTVVALATIAISSWLMMYNHQLYRALEPFIRLLTPFAHGHRSLKRQEEIKPFDVLLLGAHRLGEGLLSAFQEREISYLVVDHDPQLVSHLQSKGVPAVYGAVEDVHFLDSLDFSDLKMILSTIPEVEISAFLLDYAKHRKEGLSVICVANHLHLANQLYQLGATYVVMPPYLGRRFMVDLFKKNVFNTHKYRQERQRHLQDLEYILSTR